MSLLRLQTQFLLPQDGPQLRGRGVSQPGVGFDLLYAVAAQSEPLLLLQ